MTMLASIFLEMMIPLVPEGKGRCTIYKAVDLIFEKDQEFSITTQLSFTHGATVLPGGCDLENEECEDEHDEIGEHDKESKPEENRDELRLENDLGSDVLEAEGAFHLQGTLLEESYLSLN